MKIFKCDGRTKEGDDCKSTTTNTTFWLSIGTNNSSLFLKNGLPNSQLQELSNYDDIHFCSKDCFINRLFIKNQSI